MYSRTIRASPLITSTNFRFLWCTLWPPLVLLSTIQGEHAIADHDGKEWYIALFSTPICVPFHTFNMSREEDRALTNTFERRLASEKNSHGSEHDEDLVYTDPIHVGLRVPTEEEKRTLRRVSDALPWSAYCELRLQSFMIYHSKYTLCI